MTVDMMVWPRPEDNYYRKKCLQLTLGAAAQASGNNQRSRGDSVKHGNSKSLALRLYIELTALPDHNERIRGGPPPRKDLSSIVGANTDYPHGPERGMT